MSRAGRLPLLEPGRLGVVTHSLLQDLIEVVKGQAVDGVGIDKHLFRSPLQTDALGFDHPRVPADDEQAKEPDVTVPEIPGKPVGLFEIVQGVEPVHQLAEAVFKPPAPLLRGFPADAREDAVRAAVFKLDEAILSLLSVSERYVRGEVAEDGKLEGELSGRADVGGEGAEKRRQLSPPPEKRLNLPAFG